MGNITQIYIAVIVIAIIIIAIASLLIGKLMLETAEKKGYNIKEKHLEGLLIAGFFLGFYIFVLIYIAALPDLKTQKMLEKIMYDVNK